MAYTTVNKSTDYFNTKLYTGNNSSSHAITGVGFQPDWTWIKAQNYAESHRLFDAVRGASNYITANSSGAESSSIPLTSFDSDGFTIGTTDNSVNGSYNYASWNWKAGTTSGISGGDITPSSYSFSTVSGFSVVKYTGNGSTGATVAHGLGAAPKMVMVKGLGDTYGWKVWHTDLASGKTLNLHNNNAEATDSNIISASSSTTFTTTGTYSVNESGSDYVAYCFAEVRGFSKIGSYTGNGNDKGPFIYTGFKPAFVIIKKSTGSAQDWIMIDNKRGVFNTFGERLYPNLSNAEDTSGEYFDFYSNGFVAKTNTALWNNDNSTYVYMAFAEAPLVGSNNVPCTAR